MQIFKFVQADNRFQKLQIQIKPICYFMSYMQICNNPKSNDNTCNKNPETIKSVHFQKIGFGYSKKFSKQTILKGKGRILTLAFLVYM